ncbi:MAG: CHASE2 domain-containing protein [Leptolyngbyaceae cyanobacterium]
MSPILKNSLSKLKTLLQKSWEWHVGYVLIGAFISARWLGLFSSLELSTLDFFLRYRPSENLDEHVVIVLIDSSSFQDDRITTDRYLVRLLETVLTANPNVVGLNIFREQTTDEDGRMQLINLFEIHDNLIGIQKSLPPNRIFPLQGISSDVYENQFGLNDVVLDQDGRIRRVFIGSYLPDRTSTTEDNPFKFSFSLILAEKYLKHKGYSLENLPSDPATPSFRSRDTRKYTKIPRLKHNSGGYIREQNIADVQTLLNFRSGINTFTILDSEDLLNSTSDLEKLAGKVVIVGATDPFFPNFLPVSASSNLIEENDEGGEIIPRLGIIGSELEAHSTSQIINSVLHGRPLIETIPSLVEDALIVTAGLIGIAGGMLFQSTLRSAFFIIFSTLLTIAICCLLLMIFGIWIPVTPMTFVLATSGVTYLRFSYQSQRAALYEAQRLEAERRKAIERTFDTIHAGPLQRLSSLLRAVKDGRNDRNFILGELRALNKEIREIGDRLRQEAMEDAYFVDSGRGIKLDLNHPMHEVFYEIYSICLQKDLPGFHSIKVRSAVFDPFNCESLDLEVKRKLCWFLQESLENVGKHAIGTTRLFVTGKRVDKDYTINVDDNGMGIQSSHIGEGTKLFYRIEEELKGKFLRIPKPSKGTICQLTWSLSFRSKKAAPQYSRSEASDYLCFKDSRRNIRLDLNCPIHTLFYEICHSYLQEDLPGFRNIETCSFSFDPCHSEALTVELRRKLCICLKESLENVGVHAIGTTRLLATGTLSGGSYTLSVEDNGVGATSFEIGQGTKLFYELEKTLKGKYSRISKPTGGFIWKLTWPLSDITKLSHRK